MASQKLSVKVTTSEEILWQGDADSVSSVNSQGPFDILPMHANFISTIEQKPIVVRIGREKKEFNFSYSVIYAHSNHVQIYTNL